MQETGSQGAEVGKPSGSLILRQHSLVRLQDISVSTAPVVFGSKVFTWADLPARTRRLARRDDPVLAERVVADTALYESESGVVQVLRAWRAHRGAVVVAVVLRTVRVDGEAVRPTGQWDHVSLDSYAAGADPRRRAGVVASAVLVTRPTASHAGTTASHDTAAREAWQYLPAAVRQSAEKAVPLPEDWLGDLRQIGDAGDPVSQEIIVLRRSASSAAVVVARRHAPEMVGATADEVAQRLAPEPWSVELLTYAMHVPASLGSAPPPAALPWR